MKLHERLIAMFLVFAATTSFAAEPSLLDEKVRQLAAERVKAGAYPTLVIGVIRGTKQDVVTFGAATENTIYEIGSVTKTFTALLLADAVQRGEVSLDDPVQKLLPGFTIPRDGDRQITLLDLATQSSGLPRLPENLLPKDAANPYADYTPAKMKAFLAAYKLPRAPGTTYEYSNFGFGLLGYALATQAHIPYAELVTRRITTPLGMKDTAVVLSPDAAKRVAAGNPIARWDFDALAGAGAVKSTAHDMLIYVRAMMKGGPAALATAPRRATETATRRIGLAWMTEARGGRDVVWHNGMTGGYASFVGFTADGERGAVVLTNSSRDVTDLGMLALLPETMTPPAKEIALTEKAAAAYAGRYRLAPGFDLVVRADGNQLRAAATGQGELPLFASGPDEFFYKAVDARVSFRRDAAGKVTSLVLHQNGNDMPAPRVEAESPAATADHKEIALDPASLQAYVGRYPLAPGFALEVTAEKGQLYVQATAQPRIPVYASAINEFFYKVVDARLTFERDAAGKVIAVVLHQNGQHVRGAKE